MGWTSYHAEFYKNGKIDRKSELDNRFSWSSETTESDVLRSAMVGSVYYAAIRYENKTNGTTCTWAAVCLTSVNMRDWYNFSYKDMDETMMPYYYDCPKRILDLLSETDNASALEWRERCRAEIERKKNRKRLTVGTVIEFPWGPNETKRAYLHQAAYQFKRPFWMTEEGRYIPHTRIPKNYTIIEEGRA